MSVLTKVLGDPNAREVKRHLERVTDVNELEPLIKQVEAMLIKQRPNIKSFHEDNGQDLLASGEVDVVMEYNGDIAQVMAEDDDLNFVVPKEGAMKQSDTLAIPKGAPHPENALKFINFILDAKVGAEISETIKYPSPNAAAVAQTSAARLDPEKVREVLQRQAEILATGTEAPYPATTIATTLAMPTMNLCMTILHALLRCGNDEMAHLSVSLRNRRPDGGGAFNALPPIARLTLAVRLGAQGVLLALHLIAAEVTVDRRRPPLTLRHCLALATAGALNTLLLDRHISPF